jgi:FkbM family methyltransferase
MNYPIEPMTKPSRLWFGIATLLGLSLGSALAGIKIGRDVLRNEMCCQVPRNRSFVLTLEEVLGMATFPSQIGQDKWVSEAIFPDVNDGFFLDVGSGDGTLLSNTKVLEEKGWTGVCIDPFPTNMQGRTCQMLEEVVFSEGGKRVSFRVSGQVSGIEETLGRHKAEMTLAPRTEFTTVTLADVLERTKAPPFIHFVSLDIEGAEFEALRGFPFDRYKMGALAVEHNFEDVKRSQIFALMTSHGYKRVNSWEQDDFYVPNESPLPSR